MKILVTGATGFLGSRVVLLGLRYRTDRWLHMGSGLAETGRASSEAR